MELYQYFLYLGILFIIIEMFLLTLDFLALWVAGLITSLLIYTLWLNVMWQVWLIFLVIWVWLMLLSRKFILPKWKKQDNSKWTLSIETVIWDSFIVQDVWWANVVYHEWVYWKIKWENIKPWDTVKVDQVEWNIFKVTKMI